MQIIFPNVVSIAGFKVLHCQRVIQLHENTGFPIFLSSHFNKSFT
jgi:hypothetical protein